MKRPARNSQHAAFKRVFGIKLSRYWDVTGFDAIKFDEEFIKPPDGTSTAEAITERYGQAATDLVFELVGL